MLELLVVFKQCCDYRASMEDQDLRQSMRGTDSNQHNRFFDKKDEPSLSPEKISETKHGINEPDHGFLISQTFSGFAPAITSQSI